MLGAIIGDIVGSVHEFVAIPTKTKDFGPLFVDKISKKGADLPIDEGGFLHKGNVASHFTDDTVCTVAVARWLLNREKPLVEHMRDTCNEYPRRGYGGMFSKWVLDDSMGSYNSWGNGAPMRVSPVGWLSGSLNEAYELAKMTADITHNHPEAVKGAQAVAGIIYLIKNGSSKTDAVNKVIEDLDESGHYKHITSKSIDEIRPDYRFDVSSKNTVPQAMLCLLEGDSFEDVIRIAISLGGDADTIAAIAGSMAEAAFTIPTDIVKDSIGRVDQSIKDTIVSFYKSIK
jgi:ADP-ribosylglycohydrolase